MTANAVPLQLHAPAYDRTNFLRTLVLPDEMDCWSLTTHREKVVKIGEGRRPRPLHRRPPVTAGGAMLRMVTEGATDAADGQSAPAALRVAPKPGRLPLPPRQASERGATNGSSALFGIHRSGYATQERGRMGRPSGKCRAVVALVGACPGMEPRREETASITVVASTYLIAMHRGR